MEMKQETKTKLVTIGDAEVGKSSLLFRVTHNQTPNMTSATIMGAYYSKSFGNRNRVARLNMWDTAGQERYRSMIPIYLKDVDIILYVYDISNRRSFEHLRDYWIDFAKNYAVPANPDVSPLHIVIANKSDLDEQREVKNEEGIELAKTINATFIELSALRGNNVDRLMELFRLYLLNDVIPKQSDETVVILDEKGFFSKITKGTCC